MTEVEFTKEMRMFGESLKDISLDTLNRWVKLCDCLWRKQLIKQELERRFEEDAV